MNKKMIVLQCALAGLLFSVLLLPMASVPNSIDVEINIDWPKEMRYDISNVSSRGISYNGTLEVTSSGFWDRSSFFLSLSANSEGWNWNIHPDKILFRENEKRGNFTLHLKPPRDYPATDVNKLMVLCEVTSLPGLATYLFRSNSHRAAVSPFIDYELEEMETEVHIESGRTYRVEVGARNEGNIPMEMTIDFFTDENLIVSQPKSDDLELSPFSTRKKVFFISTDIDNIEPERTYFLNITLNGSPPVYLSYDFHEIPSNNKGNINYINMSIISYRYLPEGEWSLGTSYHPLEDIVIDEVNELAVLETVKFSKSNNWGMEILIIILVLLTLIVYYLMKRK